MNRVRYEVRDVIPKPDTEKPHPKKPSGSLLHNQPIRERIRQLNRFKQAGFPAVNQIIPDSMPNPKKPGKMCIKTPHEGNLFTIRVYT